MTKEQILTRLIKEDKITLDELLVLVQSPGQYIYPLYPYYCDWNIPPFTFTTTSWSGDCTTTSDIKNDAFKSYDPKDYKENK